MSEARKFRWYIVHTYSGFEKKAKLSLQQRIKDNQMEAYFGDLEEDILIPAEEIVEVKKGGERKTSEKKLYPGYMFIRMDLTDDSWHLVNNTPKITGFVGNGQKPSPVPITQIIEIRKLIDEGVQNPKTQIHFETGESVKVIDGPFMNFNGEVDEVNPEKGKIRVMVSIFGRSTPVELEFTQVEKLK